MINQVDFWRNSQPGEPTIASNPGSLRGRQAACGFVEQGTQPGDRRIPLLVLVPLQSLGKSGNGNRAAHHAQGKAPGHLVCEPRWQCGNPRRANEHFRHQREVWGDHVLAADAFPRRNQPCVVGYPPAAAPLGR